MDIFKSSYVCKFINKIDLSNPDLIQQKVENSYLYKAIALPVNIIHSVTGKFSDSSVVSKYIDYVILANLLVLMFSLTFCPTVIIGLLVGSGLGLTFLKWLIRPEGGHEFTVFDIPVFVYVAVAFISVAFSSYFMPSLKGFAKMLTYFSSYIVFTNIFSGKISKIYLLFGALAIAGGLESLVGLYQKFAGVEALATWQDPNAVMAGREMSRVYGTLVPFNPNLLAGYLLPVLPVAFGLGILTWLKKNFYWSIPFFGFSITTLVCIVLTGSRGAYIAVAMMALVVYLIAGHIIWNDFRENKYFKLLIGGWLLAGVGSILLVLVAFLSMPVLQDRVMSIFTLRGNSSNSFRINVYMASFEMFKDNWLIGIGPGNTTFRLVYGLYMITGFDALGTYCVPLEIAVEMGIIGLLAFGWLVLAMFSNSAKIITSHKLLEVKILVAIILTAIVGMFGQGLVDTIWYRPQVHVIFWMLVAALSCIVSRKVLFKEDAKDS